jgi:hypothetical protein
MDRRIIVLVVVALLAAVAFPVLIDLPSSTKDRLVQWSNYGQSFGVVAAIVGSLALLCTLYTIQQQGEQIGEAREQTKQAQEQTTAAVEALYRQAEMTNKTAEMTGKNAEMIGLAALLDFYYHHRSLSGTPEECDRKSKQCAERLEKFLTIK